MTAKVMKGMTTLFIFINRPAIFKTSLSWFNSTRVYKRNQGVFSSPKKSIKIFHAKSLQIMEKRIRNNIKIRTALSVLDRAVLLFSSSCEIIQIKNESEPVPDWKQVRISLYWWTIQDLNLWPPARQPKNEIFYNNFWLFLLIFVPERLFSDTF